MSLTQRQRDILLKIERVSVVPKKRSVQYMLDGKVCTYQVHSLLVKGFLFRDENDNLAPNVVKIFRHGLETTLEGDGSTIPSAPDTSPRHR